MLWKTHLAFGALFGLVLMPFVPHGNAFLYMAIVLIGALLPDIDNDESKMSIPVVSNFIKAVFGHRGIIHSLWGMAMLCGLVYFVVSDKVGIALAAGYLSHLLIDGLTKAGINFLHPVGKLRIQGFITTGGMGELVLFMAILVILGIQLFRTVIF